MSTSATRVEQRRFEDIGTWMLEDKPPQVPEVLRGVFFMDGNSLPEDCGTFQGLTWNAEKLTLALPLSAPMQWTFEDSERGRKFMSRARSLRNVLEFKFEDENLKKGKVTPIYFGFLRIPGWILEFRLIRGEDDGDTWERVNCFFFGTLSFGNYTLRRVVRPDGQPTPAFEDMLARLPETCLVNVIDET